MTWLVDPETREMLPAFEAADVRLRRVCGEHEWLGAHVDISPDWEQSTVDECGFQYIRRCQRPCVHLTYEAAVDMVYGRA
jgi:hypothetical protein